MDLDPATSDLAMTTPRFGPGWLETLVDLASGHQAPHRTRKKGHIDGGHANHRGLVLGLGFGGRGCGEVDQGPQGAGADQEVPGGLARPKGRQPGNPSTRQCFYQASRSPGKPSAPASLGFPVELGPIVMVSIVCKYSGALRCQADHGPSHSRLETDAPLDNQGKGERFSPTDLVATALASCILTVMGIMAERHGWALEGCSARVEKTMTTSGRRKIAKLEVWIQWPVGLEDQAKAVLQRAAEGCPVKESLEGTVAMELHWI